MFADDILKRQKEVIKKQEEEEERQKKEKEEKNLKVAMRYIEEVKTKLLKLADQGKSLSVIYKSAVDLDECFDILRELGWKEGINVIHDGGIFDFSSYEKIFNFQILDFTVKDSFKNMCTSEQYLTSKENIYLDKEQEYSIKLSNGETFSSIEEEIIRDTASDQRIFMNALLNAAYRNGMEGEIPEVFPKMKEIKPTILNYISKDRGHLETIENYMHILHNKSKEKQKQIKKS